MTINSFLICVFCINFKCEIVFVVIFIAVRKISDSQLVHQPTMNQLSIFGLIEEIIYGYLFSILLAIPEEFLEIALL